MVCGRKRDSTSEAELGDASTILNTPTSTFLVLLPLIPHCAEKIEIQVLRGVDSLSKAGVYGIRYYLCFVSQVQAPASSNRGWLPGDFLDGLSPRNHHL